MPTINKTTLQYLSEADSGQLLDIIMTLCDKHKTLAEEIEFLIKPKSIKKPQSYYNKLVKKAIDTNSWSKFPNKGVKGLEQMLSKMNFFVEIGNPDEAVKLARAISDIVMRCRKKYNSQNQAELEQIAFQAGKVFDPDANRDG